MPCVENNVVLLENLFSIVLYYVFYETIFLVTEMM